MKWDETWYDVTEHDKPPNTVYIIHSQNNPFHVRWLTEQWWTTCNSSMMHTDKMNKHTYTSRRKSEQGWRGACFYEGWESTRVVFSCMHSFQMGSLSTQHNIIKHPSHPTSPNCYWRVQIWLILWKVRGRLLTLTLSLSPSYFYSGTGAAVHWLWSKSKHFPAVCFCWFRSPTFVL